MSAFKEKNNISLSRPAVPAAQIPTTSSRATRTLMKLSLAVAKKATFYCTSFLIWFWVKLIILPFIYKGMVPASRWVLTSPVELVKKMMGNMIPRLLAPAETLATPEAPRSISPSHCIQAHEIDGTCTTGACQGHSSDETDSRPGGLDIPRRMFGKEFLHAYYVSRPLEELPALGKFPLFILPDESEQHSFHHEALDMPRTLVSQETLELLGFSQSKALELWIAWTSRRPGAEWKAMAQDFLDFIVENTTQEPRSTVLIRSGIDQCKKKVSEWFPKLSGIISTVQEVVDLPAIHPEIRGQVYPACLEKFGLSDHVVACLSDPEHERTRKQHAPAYWVEKVIKARYGLLRWAAQPRKSLFRDPWKIRVLDDIPSRGRTYATHIRQGRYTYVRQDVISKASWWGEWQIDPPNFE